jgi:hypothetical protein
LPNRNLGYVGGKINQRWEQINSRLQADQQRDLEVIEIAEKAYIAAANTAGFIRPRVTRQGGQ